MGENLLTPRELRERLSISKTFYDTLIKEDMPHMKISPRARRFNYDEVVAWLETRKVNSESGDEGGS